LGGAGAPACSLAAVLRAAAAVAARLLGAAAAVTLVVNRFDGDGRFLSSALACVGVCGGGAAPYFAVAYLVAGGVGHVDVGAAPPGALAALAGARDACGAPLFPPAAAAELHRDLAAPVAGWLWRAGAAEPEHVSRRRQVIAMLLNRGVDITSGEPVQATCISTRAAPSAAANPYLAVRPLLAAVAGAATGGADARVAAQLARALAAASGPGSALAALAHATATGAPVADGHVGAALAALVGAVFDTAGALAGATEAHRAHLRELAGGGVFFFTTRDHHPTPTPKMRGGRRFVYL
jgi:hypothetical protein